jgi:hypothetical protein
VSLDYREIARLAHKGRRAEQRGKAAVGCVTAIFTSALNAFVDGWLLMLAVGILHIHWWPALPTIGYWWAVITVALLRGVFSRTLETKKVPS